MRIPVVSYCLNIFAAAILIVCARISPLFLYHWEAQDLFCTLDWVLNLLYKLFILVAFYLRALIRGNFCIVYYTIPKLPRINVTCLYLPHLTIYIYIYIYTLYKYLYNYSRALSTILVV